MDGGDLKAAIRRIAVLAGIWGPVLFAAALAGLTWAQYDFMRSLGWEPLRAPTLDWPSGLALGPYGGWMTAAFLLGGAAMTLFAIGLRAALPGRSGRLGTVLLALAGLALAGLAFKTDPTLRSAPATWHGRLHDLSFALLGLLLMPAMIALGFAFRGDDRWKGYSAYTWCTAALALPTFALKGPAFYAFLAAVLGWSEAAAVRSRRLLAAHSSGPLSSGAWRAILMKGPGPTADRPAAKVKPPRRHGESR